MPESRLIIFAKSSMLDVWLGSEYASGATLPGKISYESLVGQWIKDKACTIRNNNPKTICGGICKNNFLDWNLCFVAFRKTVNWKITTSYISAATAIILKTVLQTCFPVVWLKQNFFTVAFPVF